MEAGTLSPCAQEGVPETSFDRVRAGLTDQNCRTDHPAKPHQMTLYDLDARRCFMVRYLADVARTTAKASREPRREVSFPVHDYSVAQLDEWRSVASHPHLRESRRGNAKHGGNSERSEKLGMDDCTAI